MVLNARGAQELLYGLDGLDGKHGAFGNYIHAKFGYDFTLKSIQSNRTTLNELTEANNFMQKLKEINAFIAQDNVRGMGMVQAGG